jgi:hypothetical protein
MRLLEGALGLLMRSVSAEQQLAKRQVSSSRAEFHGT